MISPKYKAEDIKETSLIEAIKKVSLADEFHARKYSTPLKAILRRSCFHSNSDIYNDSKNMLRVQPQVVALANKYLVKLYRLAKTQLRRYNIALRGRYSALFKVNQRVEANPINENIKDNRFSKRRSQSVSQSMVCYSHLSRSRKKLDISNANLGIYSQIIGLIDRFGKYALNTSCKNLRNIGIEEKLIKNLIKEIERAKSKWANYRIVLND